MRIGIIGTGRIANRFVPEAALVDGVQTVCVYNPHAESAAAFAGRWGLAACDSLEEFFDAVDMVYIASPHGTHYPYARQALLHGKHVLCEKPMCFSKDQAKELFAIAERQDKVVLEGLKTAYCPGFAKVIEVAESGAIGEIRNIEACFTKLCDVSGRELTDPDYGGSFAELGSYCMLPVFRLFGTDYEQLRFETIRNENGRDLFTKAFFRYSNQLATAACGLGVKSEGQLLICGTTGYLRVDAPWWKTTTFSVHHEDPSDVTAYTAEYAGDGLRYELAVLLAMTRGGMERERALAWRESAAMAETVKWFLQKDELA